MRAGRGNGRGSDKKFKRELQKREWRWVKRQRKLGRLIRRTEEIGE